MASQRVVGVPSASVAGVGFVGENGGADDGGAGLWAVLARAAHDDGDDLPVEDAASAGGAVEADAVDRIVAEQPRFLGGLDLYAADGGGEAVGGGEEVGDVFEGGIVFHGRGRVEG